MVRATQQQGRSVNNGRIVSGMPAVGGPVMGESGRANAALWIAATRERMGPGRISELVAMQNHEAAGLGRLVDPRRLGQAEAGQGKVGEGQL